MHRHLKRALGFALSAAVAVSVLAVGASAIEYTAPTTGVIANDRILAGATSKAATHTLSMLGINIVASSTQGFFNANGTSSEWGSDTCTIFSITTIPHIQAA